MLYVQQGPDLDMGFPDDYFIHKPQQLCVAGFYVGDQIGEQTVKFLICHGGGIGAALQSGHISAYLLQLCLHGVDLLCQARAVQAGQDGVNVGWISFQGSYPNRDGVAAAKPKEEVQGEPLDFW